MRISINLTQVQIQTCGRYDAAINPTHKIHTHEHAKTTTTARKQNYHKDTYILKIIYKKFNNSN